MSDLSASLPPVPVGPVVTPAPAPRRPFYVWHSVVSPTLPNGKAVARGDVLRGADALSFELAVSEGILDANYATGTDTDPEA